ncbi:MAG: hypothetical protein ABJA66_12565 [Actinomycetota bacterium]
MKITKYLTIMAAVFLMLGTACNKNAETKNTAVNQPTANISTNTNQLVANANSNQPEANQTDKSTSSSSLATPADVYKAFYSARQKKDIDGLKKVLAKDALDFFTEMSKVDGKTLDDGLKEIVAGKQAPTAETRNEKIDGAKATLEYLDEKGGWSPMDFVKEGKDWKVTIAKPNPKDVEINGKKQQ